MNKIIFWLLAIGSFYFFYFLFVSNSKNDLNYKSFSNIPILHEGRIKPLSSFADIHLLAIHGKKTIDGMLAIEWLSELLFDQDAAFRRNVFYIPNSDIATSIGLGYRKKYRYSFVEVISAIKQHSKLLENLYNTKQDNKTLAQEQLLGLYRKFMWYFSISRSMSLVLPQFLVKDNDLAKELEVNPGEFFSYLHLRNKKDTLIKLFRSSSSKSIAKEEKQRLIDNLRLLLFESRSQLFRVIPPVKGKVWISPWESTTNSISIGIMEQLILWQEIAQSYKYKEKEKWIHSTTKLKDKTIKNLSVKINTETFYNKANLFSITKFLYGVVFTSCIIGYFINHRIRVHQFLYQSTRIVLYIALIFHFCDILFRVYIMSRPPIATLYESIISVGLISVLLSLFLDKYYDNKFTIFIFIGALLGGSFQHIASKYMTDGDTMGMLAAVLNTNFWLATHVITITVGYSCCFIAGTLGHIYLYQAAKESIKNKKNLNRILENIIAITLLSLFFTIFGTILGGVWADQSWGRFWGWDPKENGALFIILWLILLLHGRLTKLLSPLIFAVGIICSNIVVLLAWFGVNLLNVGLHSYGFTQDIGYNLTLFSLLELIYIVIFLSIRKYKEEVLGTLK